MLCHKSLFAAVMIALLGAATAGFSFSNFPRTDHWKTEYVDLSLTLGSGANADQVQNDLYVGQDPVSGAARFAATWTESPHLVTIASSTLMYTYSTTDALTGKKTSHVRTDFWDIGVLYGRRLLSGKSGLLQASAGLALTHLNYKDTVGFLEDGTRVMGIYEHLVVGVPVDVHALWTVSPGFGLGADIFGNVNFDNIFYGGGLSINFGF